MSVRTGAGAHIYCGLPQEEACSPFQVTVAPGPTIPSSSEAEGDASPAIDALVEGVAGMTGYFNIQVTARIDTSMDMLFCHARGLVAMMGFSRCCSVRHTAYAFRLSNQGLTPSEHIERVIGFVHRREGRYG